MIENELNEIEENEQEDISENSDVVEENTTSEDSVESNELTAEDIDRVADCAVEMIQNIVGYFNIGEITIDEFEGEEGELILDIRGDELSILIGRHGVTLDSLQVLVSYMVRSQTKKRLPIIIDIEGYKARQKEKLEDKALNMADKAVSQNREIKLRPMNPYERRIVHMALRDDERVETISEGEGGSRRVVIYPITDE